jgi:hypothetical protein
MHLDYESGFQPSIVVTTPIFLGLPPQADMKRAFGA